MTTVDALDLGREAFGRRAWRDAYAQLLAADREASLAPEDLERLATAAHLIGRETDSADVWARAITGFLTGTMRPGPPAVGSGSPSTC